MLKVLHELLIIKKHINTLIHHNNATIKPEILCGNIRLMKWQVDVD